MRRGTPRLSHRDHRRQVGQFHGHRHRRIRRHRHRDGVGEHPAGQHRTDLVGDDGAPDTSTGVVTGTVARTDADGDTLKYAAPTSTSKGSITINASTGAFTYTPTAPPGTRRAH